MTFNWKKNAMLKLTLARMAEKERLAKEWGQRGGPGEKAVDQLQDRYSKGRPDITSLPF